MSENGEKYLFQYIFNCLVSFDKDNKFSDRKQQKFTLKKLKLGNVWYFILKRESLLFIRIDADEFSVDPLIGLSTNCFSSNLEGRKKEKNM